MDDTGYVPHACLHVPRLRRKMPNENIALANKNSSRNDRNRGGTRSGMRGGRSGNPGRGGFKRKFAQFPRENGKRSKLDIGSRLKELDIGITEHVGEHARFSAIIKERYTDFHVNEIDLDGRVAKLTHQDIPPEPDDGEDVEDLKKSIPSAIWDQLQTLKEENPASSDMEIDVTSLDKAKRKTIHIIAKKLAKVISQTVNKGDKKFIAIVRSKSNKSGNRIYKDNRIDWKRRGGDYCHFLLHKVNMDTMDALNRLAMSLRIRPDKFGYAGTKDRRAWTTQWVSLRKVDPCDILRAGKAVYGAYVGNFKYAKDSLKLGGLRGNRFRIALRSTRGTDDEIERAMTSLRDNGFINYYGLQRFGTIAAIPTHEIGKRLLQGKWHEAIDLILKPRPGEQDKELTEARRIYAETKDAYAAYVKIKRLDKIEARLLKGLQISGNENPLGALDSVPRNIRLMYIHAYQSFVWNHIVSRRIKQFGTNVIAGDLVYEERSGQQDVIEATDYSASDVKDENFANDVKDENYAIFTEEGNIDSTANEEGIEAKSSQAELTKSTDNLTEAREDAHDLPTVKILTESDLPNYTLADVIMPQPGWKVTYPPYAKAWFDEFLAKDELTTDLRQKNKKYSLSGTYRKILEIPTNLSWKIMHYKEKHDNLIMSDIDEMRKLTPPQDEPDGENKALIIEMCLKSSNYATMALREILKSDTSAETQAALSASYDTNHMQSDVTTVEEITKAESSSATSTESKRDNAVENYYTESHQESADTKDGQIMEADEAENTVKV